MMGGQGSGRRNDERGAAILALYRQGLHGSEIARQLRISAQAVSLRLARAGISRRVPPVTERKILAWAKAHKARHDRHSVESSGSVEGTSGINWSMVNHWLRTGLRGLAGGSSPPRLLRERLGPVAARCGTT